MAKKIKPIDVHFYRCSVSEKGGRRQSTRDWTEDLTAAGQLPLDQRTHEDDVYEVIRHEDLVLVGAHRVINTDFMTEIDPQRQSIRDIMEDAETRKDVRRFAHTTVMAFMPRHNAVAVARGGANSPRALSAVQYFLTRHLDPGAGASWMVEPIMTPDKTAELRKAKGVLSFEGRFETQRLLDDPDPGRAGIASHVDDYANTVGGDLVVDVNLRIAPGYKNSQTAQAVKDLFFRDLPRLVGSGKKVQARALYDDDTTELLDIVAGNLTGTMELGKDASESRRYSELLEGLKTVTREMQTEVDRLVEG